MNCGVASMLYIQLCLTAYPDFSIENKLEFTSNHIKTMVMNTVHFCTVPGVLLPVLPSTQHRRGISKLCENGHKL